MNKEQARALLALIADLYLLINEPVPQPKPVENHVAKKVEVR